MAKLIRTCNTRRTASKELVNNSGSEIGYCCSRNTDNIASFEICVYTSDGKYSYFLTLNEKEAIKLNHNLSDSLARFKGIGTVTETEKELFKAGKWIAALKEYRIRTGVSLKTAKMWADKHRLDYN